MSNMEDYVHKEEVKVSKIRNSKMIHFAGLILRNLKENKLYLLSFLITLSFFLTVSVLRVKDSDGIFGYNKDDVVNSSNQNSSEVVPSSSNDSLDVSNYVGIYSREVVLSSPIKLSNSCTLSKYKELYQIKKDKTISKYIYSSCLGTFKIWSDGLGYVSTSGARYIGSHGINYLFSTNSLTEVDGETYKIDTGITTIRVGSKINDLEIIFYDSDLVLLTNDNLVSLSNGNVTYVLSDYYTNNGGELEKRVYQSSNKVYKFIVFYNGEKNICYSDAGDESNYKIYSITYNEESHSLESVKEIVSRNKNDGCDKYNEDLEELMN